MRILFTIAHFFDPHGGGKHGSLAPDPRPRAMGLALCVSALYQAFGRAQAMFNFPERKAYPVNQNQANELEVVVCTTGDRHLLGQLPLPSSLYKHHATAAEPKLLGFECQAVLRDRLGQFDYYCFLEDDLIIHDSWFFHKLAWFTRQLGFENLLQPNRYEISFEDLAHKAYIDGTTTREATARYQNIEERPQATGNLMDTSVRFLRPTNPHAGCYFLNAQQMAHWAAQPYFLDRDTGFIGPLESAASLGIMRTFCVYKPAPENAGFLEIQHQGRGFISQIGSRYPVVADPNLMGRN